MYFDGDGAPWTFPQWQRLTRVSSGLFPADDDQLSEGWTRENANFIRSYFDQYNKHTKEDARINFSAARKNGPQVPELEAKATEAFLSESHFLPPSTYIYIYRSFSVHALIRTNFTPQAEPGRCCGMLIADEVGLGKTFQAVTTIAFLSDLIIRAERNAPMPPIIGTYNCLILFIQSTNLMPLQRPIHTSLNIKLRLFLRGPILFWFQEH